MNQAAPTTRSIKSEMRRQQILDAATESFRQSGFHGASIAKISHAAGMSPGHIYHFFKNKEAIIAAIVERKVENALEIVSGFEKADDMLEAMIGHVDHVVEEKTAPEFGGIWLEVLSEAARNPEMAALVQASDLKMRERITQLEERARQLNGIDSGLNPGAVTEVVMAMFQGLTNRIVQNPDMDKIEVAKVLRVALRAVLEHSVSGHEMTGGSQS